jgi:hypothetical protein
VTKETTTEEKEVWKNIVELNEVLGEEIWTECYEISNLGRLRAVCRRKYQPYYYMRIMSPQVNRDGYLSIKLPNALGTYSHLLVHRAVALLFLPLPTSDISLMQVDHLDEDKTNPVVTNLEWVTKAENIQRTFAKGREPWNKGKTYKINNKGNT